jgi:hypothetical protein
MFASTLILACDRSIVLLTIGVGGAGAIREGLPHFSDLEVSGPAVGSSRVVFAKEVGVSKKLYIGNLSYETNDNALQEMFAAFGSVQSAQVILDRYTGRSKGFGFVEMSNDQEAQAAISGLNGKEAGGRPLTVNEARPREERGGGRGGYGGGGTRGHGGGR